MHAYIHVHQKVQEIWDQIIGKSHEDQKFEKYN